MRGAPNSLLQPTSPLARPLGGQTDKRNGKKGSDKGIDGIKVFVDDNSGKAKRVIVQVKSGHVKSGDIRDLVGALDREGSACRIMITRHRRQGFRNAPGLSLLHRRKPDDGLARYDGRPPKLGFD